SRPHWWPWHWERGFSDSATGHSANFRPVGRVVDAPQVLDSQGACVVVNSTLPRCHRILFLANPLSNPHRRSRWPSLVSASRNGRRSRHPSSVILCSCGAHRPSSTIQLHLPRPANLVCFVFPLRATSHLGRGPQRGHAAPSALPASCPWKPPRTQ